MPDHVHGVIVIGESRNQPSGQSLRVAPGSLGAVIRAFKSATTKRINEIHSTPGKKVWQRNYYDRIIRTDRELDRARRYIMTNPDRWTEPVSS